MSQLQQLRSSSAGRSDPEPVAPLVGVITKRGFGIPWFPAAQNCTALPLFPSVRSERRDPARVLRCHLQANNRLTLKPIVVFVNVFHLSLKKPNDSAASRHMWLLPFILLFLFSYVIKDIFVYFQTSLLPSAAFCPVLAAC